MAQNSGHPSDSKHTSRPGAATILVTRHDALGDLITTLPLADALYEMFPHCRVIFLVKEPFIELVELHPLVSKAIVAGELEFKPLYRRLRAGGQSITAAAWSALSTCRAEHRKLMQVIQDEQVDIAVCAWPRYRLARLLYKAKVPLRIGTGKRWYSFLFNLRHSEHRKHSRYHESVYNLHLLQPLIKKIGLPVPELIERGDKHLTLEKLATFDLPRPEKRLLKLKDAFVVIHPFKTASSLKWPEEKFARLIELLQNNAPSLTIVLTGLQNERPGLDRLKSSAPDQRRLQVFSDLPLSQLAVLYSRATAWFGNSTGPMHLASWLGIPVIGLFGRAPAFTSRRWGPVYQKDGAGLEADVPQCRRCSYEKCAYFNCIDRIDARHVFEQAAVFLDKKKPPQW